jgi:hypothetical protein
MPSTSNGLTITASPSSRAAPAKHDAGVKITASDGESRVIGVGEVILVEDITGKGHLSQHVEGKIRHSIFVPID